MPPHPDSPIPYIDHGHLFALARLSMTGQADIITVSLDMGFNIEYKGRLRLCHVDCPNAQSDDPLEKRASGVAALLVQFWIKTSDSLVVACASPVLMGGLILGDLVRPGSGDSLSQLLFHTGCAKKLGQSWTPLELERCVAEGCKIMSLDPASLPKSDVDRPLEATNGSKPPVDVGKPAGQD